MAKTIKKVSITSIDAVIKEHFQNQKVVQWHGVDVAVKYNIGLIEMLEFVNDVVNSCIGETNGYMPEVLDFAVKSNIVSKYANFSLPDNLEHRYSIIYQSDIVEFVCEHINLTQAREIREAIEDKVASLCDANIVGIQSQMQELVSSFEAMQQKTSDVFQNITPDDIATIMSAMGDGKLDADKIVGAYLDKTRPADTVGEATDA